MKELSLLKAMVFFLVLTLPTYKAYGETEPPSEAQPEPPSQTQPTTDDLEKELRNTLDAIRSHFRNVQDRLEETGADRDPTVDKAIGELGKEQQTMEKTIEGLAKILLEAHTAPNQSNQPTSTTKLEDIQAEVTRVNNELESYIAEREKYWENTQADPEVMLQEEMKRLDQEQENLEQLLQPLAKLLEGVWNDVMGGWGDALRDWEKAVKDLTSDEEK